MVKGGADSFALAGGDAQAGELTRIYDGPRPHGYQPMKKQGSIILGIGGDNSNRAVGTFYEGVRISTHRSPRQARAPSAAGICLSGAQVVRAAAFHQCVAVVGLSGAIRIRQLWSVAWLWVQVMTAGFASNATDAAVQANIVGAGYGK